MDMLKILFFIILSGCYYRIIEPLRVLLEGDKMGECPINCQMYEPHVVIRVMHPHQNTYAYARRGILVSRIWVLTRPYTLLHAPAYSLRVAIPRGSPIGRTCNEYEIYTVAIKKVIFGVDSKDNKKNELMMLKLTEEVNGRVAKLFKPSPHTRHKELYQLCNNNYLLIGNGNNTAVCCNTKVSFISNAECQKKTKPERPDGYPNNPLYQGCLSTRNFGLFLLCNDTFYGIISYSGHGVYVFNRLDLFWDSIEDTIKE